MSNFFKIGLFISVFNIGLISTNVKAQDTAIAWADFKRTSDTHCESFTSHKWKKGYGRVIFSGAGTKEIEFGGWLMDFSDSASVTGLNGASARITGSRNGPTNVGANCSTYGSVIVSLTLPAVSQPVNANLKIGNETLPIRVLPRQVNSNIHWFYSNNATGTEPTYAELQKEYQKYVGAKERDEQQCKNDNAPEYATQCELRYEPLPMNQVFPDTNTARIDHMTRCAASYGLKATVIENKISIILPDNRTEFLMCADLPIRVGISPLAFADFHMQDVQSFQISKTGNYPQIKLNQNLAYNAVLLDRDSLSSLVGQYDEAITYQGITGNNKLYLSLKSEINYGVQKVSAPLFIESGGKKQRISSSINASFKTVQAAYPGQQFKWKLDGTFSIPCFNSTTGTISPQANTTDTIITLSVKEDAVCYGKEFNISVSPKDRENHPLYSRSVSFVLPPLTRIIVPQQQPNVIALVNLRVNGN